MDKLDSHEAAVAAFFTRHLCRNLRSNVWMVEIWKPCI
jgi:hypothetical protein